MTGLVARTIHRAEAAATFALERVRVATLHEPQKARRTDVADHAA